MVTLWLVAAFAGLGLMLAWMHGVIVRARERHWSRPDPALTITSPVVRYVGYDYQKAVAGKLRAARRELRKMEAAQPEPAHDAPRLRVMGGRR